MARKSFTLYWSSLTTYEDCPQRFLWSRGWGAIDCGGGPGRRKPIAEKRSAHHAVMGIAIQEAIELFYNEELWKTLAPPILRAKLLDLARKAFDRELTRSYVDWRVAPPRDELWQLVRNGVLGYMRTLKAHMLLGPYAKAEVDLVAYIDKWNPVGGRADVILRRESEPYIGVSILDGKNSKRYKDGKGGLMTFTDPDQLRWYAMLYYLCYRKMPDRVGFTYFRYPYGDPVLDVEGKETGELEPGVEWVEFTMEDLKGLAQRAVDARKGMNKEKFEATPTPKTCKFCDWEKECPERKAQKAANRRTRKPKSDSLAEIHTEAGMLTFGGGSFGKKGG